MEMERDYKNQIRDMNLEIESLNEKIRTITHYKENYDSY